MPPLEKRYPVFDCDAHITELPDIWDYLSEKEKELVKPWFWADGINVIVNGNQAGLGTWAFGRTRTENGTAHGFQSDGRRIPNLTEVSGPGVNKKIIRKLYSMHLTEEQFEYINHKGAREPHARVADMDLQGIDQVVVIPLMMFSTFLFVKNFDAAVLMARAYNDWVYDWCSVAPDRLFPAAILPLQNPQLAAKELRQAAKRGFKVAMVRPIDVQGRYPNKPAFEPLWRAFEETGLVVGMHTLTGGFAHKKTAGESYTPGAFVDLAVNPRQLGAASQTLSFAHESMVWLVNVLLSGFLERHPGITRMAIMESNASWLPMLLEECDRAFHLYRNERTRQLTRLPSEIFHERCFIAFEGDETPVYRQHSFYEHVGIWSSDVYHHDGADAWTAIREMEELGVPEAVQAKLMGANASRMYGIEQKTFTTNEPESYHKPDWYPKTEDVEREYADRMTVR